MAIIEEKQALEKNETWDIVKNLKRELWQAASGSLQLNTKLTGQLKGTRQGWQQRGTLKPTVLIIKFAPFAKLNTIRVLLSLAINLDWTLQQIDVKKVFLNGDLEEEIYMDLPPGFDEERSNGKVCLRPKIVTASLV